ncbi:MAG: polyphosphate kinase 2 family protein [Proteobacteria bacterium]|nr:polyphosphate kinase 2 family protein [Pseudomonadota bacterium]
MKNASRDNARGRSKLRLEALRVVPGTRVDLARDHDPGFTAGLRDKGAATARLARNVARLAAYQEQLYAQNVHALLVVIQALDAAGKDSVIEHVLSGVNPLGCQVTSFKTPSAEELDHDYLWRCSKALPARGMIGVFNRSYYEEVLVVRVHPEYLARQRLPANTRKGIWPRRYREINAFERYLVDNGILVLKLFLNVSRDMQRRRFLERIDCFEKNWKFAAADVQERAHWDAYQRAYAECLERTSTDWAPWYVVPADKKWFTRLAVSELIIGHLAALKLDYPPASPERRRELAAMRALLERE